MRTFRQILSVLAGLFSLFLLAGGVALTNAIGDVMAAEQEFLNFLAAFIPVADVTALADRGAAILFLSGVIGIGLAWVLWPRRS